MRMATGAPTVVPAGSPVRACRQHGSLTVTRSRPRSRACRDGADRVTPRAPWRSATWYSRVPARMRSALDRHGARAAGEHAVVHCCSERDTGHGPARSRSMPRRGEPDRSAVRIGSTHTHTRDQRCVRSRTEHRVVFQRGLASTNIQGATRMTTPTLLPTRALAGSGVAQWQSWRFLQSPGYPHRRLGAGASIERGTARTCSSVPTTTTRTTRRSRTRLPAKQHLDSTDLSAVPGDLLIGRTGDDVLLGESSSDILIGGLEGGPRRSRTRTCSLGGSGDDINIWAPGDGSDSGTANWARTSSSSRRS